MSRERPKIPEIPKSAKRQEVVELSGDDLEIIGEEKSPNQSMETEESGSSKEKTLQSNQQEDKWRPSEKENKLAQNANRALMELQAIVGSKDESNPEKIGLVKEKLRAVMKSMHDLLREIDPMGKNYTPIYGKLVSDFTKLHKIKAGADKEISQAFSEIFYEFSDFIDMGFVIKYFEEARNSGHSIYFEDFTAKIYGRTPEEIEEIKTVNRRNVIEKIKDMTQKPYISIEMIQELHAINNKSIVPKFVSEMRQYDESGVEAFGTRVGVLSQDVIPAMEDLVERTNQLIDKRALGMNKRRYELAVAKLHNDLLDIHPFVDRNGSTSLLFLELMMAREGHEPDPDRKKDYYKEVRKIMNNNLAAVAAVGYEHFLISNVPGYYKMNDLDKKRKESYETALNHVIQMRKKRSKKKSFLGRLFFRKKTQ